MAARERPRPAALAGALVVVTWLASAPATASAPGKKAVTAGAQELEVDLLADHQYEVGMPMLVSVEVRNVSATATFLMFEAFDMFTVPGPVGFTLRADSGREWQWPMTVLSHEEPRGEPFHPGDARRSLYDLSEVHPDLPAGHYQLVAEFSTSGTWARSKPADIEIRPAEGHDRAIASKLRAANHAYDSLWRGFLFYGGPMPDVSGLSAKGRARLAYYLFVHHAVHGAKPIAKLDPKEPERFAHGVLEAEGALLRLEILRAAGRPEAKGIAAAILERWPGLAWRVHEIEGGYGLLTAMRKADGAESAGPSQDEPRP